MNKNGIIIAVTGKGGVGKTSLSAAIVRQLIEKYPEKKILAIDADPAIGLATALGVEVELTIDNIRQSFVKAAESGNTKQAIEMLSEARYQIMDAVVEKDGFSFLAIGRPESSGCYCKVNAYLKEVISILSENFDYVVIDGEAGIEQVNRRVMEKVTHLLLVSDGSQKGIGVIKTIHQVAKELTMYQRAGVILNRLSFKGMTTEFDLDDLELLAKIGNDDQLLDNDMLGDSVFELADSANIIIGAKEALEKLDVI